MVYVRDRPTSDRAFLKALIARWEPDGSPRLETTKVGAGYIHYATAARGI
jgi:hypothetical protein